MLRHSFAWPEVSHILPIESPAIFVAILRDKIRGLPCRNSFRGLFVRRQKRFRLLKIFETQDSIKRRFRFVLGFGRLADTANIVTVRK